MDTARFDDKDTSITFDLFQALETQSQHLRIQALGKGPHAGWQAVEKALRRAQEVERRTREAWVQAKADLGERVDGGARASEELKEPSEANLRLALAASYAVLHGPALKSIFQAKLNDPLSFFHNFKVHEKGHQNETAQMQRCVQHWNWYLKCLTYDSRVSKRVTEEENMVCMPVDTVDLHFLSHFWRTHITMKQPLVKPRHFPMSQSADYPRHCEVLNHVDNWGVVLGFLRPEEEPRPILTSIVELGGLEGRQAGFNRQSASVESYDAHLELYTVCVSGLNVKVPRNNIVKIVWHTDDHSYGGASGSAGARGDFADPNQKDSFEPLNGIPDRSVGFHFLQEKVRRIARDRLGNMIRELAGRGILKKNEATAVHLPGRVMKKPLPVFKTDDPREQAARALGSTSQGPAAAAKTFIPEGLNNLRGRLLQGEKVHVRASAGYQPKPEESNMLQFAAHAEIRLTKVDDWNRFCGKVVDPRTGQLIGKPGWMPCESLCFFKVKQDFNPLDAGVPHDEVPKFLTLVQGMEVSILMRHDNDWSAWAYGETDHARGDFPLLSLGDEVFYCSAA